MNCSDADLVSRAQAGDAGAFDELVSRHQERVFVLAWHILGNAEDAADVQQETFVRAWTKLRDFRAQAAFTTWLHRITVNACISRKRRKDRAESVELNEMVGQGGNPSDCQDRLVDALLVRQVLENIPVNDRTLLVLREVDGMSVEEIVQVTGSSAGAVSKQLWRARKLFRERLRRHLTEDDNET